MQIAESYFQRLIDSTESSAIFELDQLWSARSGVSEDEPHFGLSIPEHNVHLALVYSGDVWNGGHAQYFCNPIGRYAAETVAALREMQLDNLAVILEDVCQIFPSGRVPSEPESRERVLSSTRAAAVLDRADKKFDRDAVCLFELLRDYIAANQSEILRPEREGQGAC